MKRIKYKKVGANQYQSIKFIPSPIGDLFAHYDMGLLVYDIISVTTGDQVAYGSAVSGNELKKAIKKSLAKLGAGLAKETRAKRK